MKTELFMRLIILILSGSITASCAEDPEKYEAAMTFLNYFYSEEAYSRLL